MVDKPLFPPSPSSSSSSSSSLRIFLHHFLSLYPPPLNSAITGFSFHCFLKKHCALFFIATTWFSRGVFFFSYHFWALFFHLLRSLVVSRAMDQRGHVPKFGNWDSEDNVPYTVYFEKARKGRGGKMINPNDPQENPDAFSNMPPSYPAPSPPHPSRTNKAQAEEPMGRGAARTIHDQRRMSREDGNYKQFAESPARTDNMSRRTSGDHSSQQQQHYGHGSNSGRPSRPSAGSEHSFDKSPLHPYYQAKVRGAGGGSPIREGKNSYDSSHGTPTRSRMKPATRADGSPDRGTAVPRFGGWDENNPQSADNYTHIFDEVRKERHTGSSNTPGARLESPYHNARQRPDDSTKGCCFPFLRK